MRFKPDFALHPATLFLLLTVLVVACSCVGEFYGLHFVLPMTGETVLVRNLLSAEGARWILRSVVSNFQTFEPVSMMVVAMIGVGIAEHSGLWEALLPMRSNRKRQRVAILSVIFIGLLSNVIGDANYILMLPLAAFVFRSSSLHPLAGVLTAFVATSAGYSANVIQTSVDAILASDTLDVAQWLNVPSAHVGSLCTSYFMAASVPLLTVVIYVMTQRYLIPLLGDYENSVPLRTRVLSSQERRAVMVSLTGGAIFVLAVLIYTFSSLGIFRAVGGGLTRSPFMDGILFLIALVMGLMGVIYGFVSGRYSCDVDVVNGSISGLRLIAPFLLLAFFSAQLNACLTYSHLSQYFVVRITDWLSSLIVAPLSSLFWLAIVTALANLCMASAAGKWMLMSPLLLVPLHQAGIASEEALCAFRIGDSATNILSPVMSYLPVLLAFMQLYTHRFSMRFLWKCCMPFSLAIFTAWLLLFILWHMVGLPLGL